MMEEHIIYRIQKGEVKYLSQKVLADKEYMMEAMKYHPAKFYPAMSDELKEDRDLALLAMEDRGYLLRYAGPELRDDKEIVRLAVSSWGLAFRNASDRLKKDKEFVREMAKMGAEVLFEVDENLRDDKRIVRLDVEKNSWNFTYASDRLKRDKKFVLELLRKDARIFNYMHPKLRDDKDIALVAIEQDPDLYTEISDRLQQDREVALFAVSKEGYLLDDMNDCFKRDKKIVEAAVRNKGYAAVYSSLHENSTRSKKRILKSAGERGIQELVHFTPLMNISSIAREGLVPRGEMDKRGMHYRCTDSQRLDRVNGTSLSVSFPNYPMFNAKRYHMGSRFCVLILDAEKIMQKDCLFFSHNAATGIFNGYDEKLDKPCRELMHRFIDFDSMFAEKSYGGYTRDRIKSIYATSPQAEIMCLDVIPPDCIKACIVNDVNHLEECKKAFREAGRNIEVRYDPWYFGKGPYELTA